MKVAILGTRGIPNNHGGFEQFTEYLSRHLATSGHEVYVYNSHNHPYQKPTWYGVHLIHKYDPESKLGTFGQFLYDLNCIRDSRKRNFDIILQLGYTSSSVWGWMLPKHSIVVTNMDGLEWKRSKYSRPVQSFLKHAERWAIQTSDYLIADSTGIQQYLQSTYNRHADFVAYGSHLFELPDKQILSMYEVAPYDYNMLIARLEPENNIETILDGVMQSQSDKDFLVIGKHETKFGRYLKKKFKDEKGIRFLGGIYEQDHLNNLRYWSNLYFHGHSVGGTNPSLLEAMASKSLIVAHDNIFNKSVLGENAFYFTTSKDITGYLKTVKSDYQDLIENNRNTVKTKYNWDLINRTYEKLLTTQYTNSTSTP